MSGKKPDLRRKYDNLRSMIAALFVFEGQSQQHVTELRDFSKFSVEQQTVAEWLNLPLIHGNGNLKVSATF
jgi:hypothetical protein